MSSSIKRNEFEIKSVFTDIMKLQTGTESYGETQNHLGVSWRLSAYWSAEPYFLAIFLRPLPTTDRTTDWSIEATVHAAPFTFNRVIPSHMLRCIDINNIYPMLTKGDLHVEFTVTVKKINGFRCKLRCFDESAKKFSDVVLGVGVEKFHVSKLFLSSVSTYFEALLLGDFNESQKSEIELNDIDPTDFQNFLEFIHGESDIEDETIDGILELADFFDAGTVIRRCQHFLIGNSKISLKRKFSAANKYNLKELKKKCLAEMKTKEDVISSAPDEPFELDQVAWSELFHKLAMF